MFAKTTFAAIVIAAGLAGGAQAGAAERHLSIGASPSGITVHVGHRYYGQRHHGHRSWRRGWKRHHRLSGRQIRRSLRRSGFVRIFDLDRRERVYVATARARNGHLYRLRVSARDGDILVARKMGWRNKHRGWRHKHRGWRYR